MPRICKKNIAHLFISAMIFLVESEDLKSFMEGLHGWSDEDYEEYLKIFIEEYNNLQDKLS